MQAKPLQKGFLVRRVFAGATGRSAASTRKATRHWEIAIALQAQGPASHAGALAFNNSRNSSRRLAGFTPRARFCAPISNAIRHCCHRTR